VSDDALQEFRVLSTVSRGTCSIVTALQQLTPEDRVLFQQAIQTPDITHTAISKWLTRRGIKRSEGTVGRHRNHQCSCDE
jgi:hypothetical protein